MTLSWSHRESSRIVSIISSVTESQPLFRRQASDKMKQKEKCVRFRLRISYGSNNIAARTYVYNWHTSADRVFWSIFPLSTFFVSASATFFSLYLFRSRLLYYFVTGLRGCFFIVFFKFFFSFRLVLRLLSSHVFFPFLFFLFLFSLAALFATNHTTRYPYFRLFDY